MEQSLSINVLFRYVCNDKSPDLNYPKGFGEGWI